MILALDPATNTGFAIGTSKGIVTSGSVSFKTLRNEGGGMRYLKAMRWLDAIVLEYGITEIYYEEVRRHSAVAAAHVYGGIVAVITAKCEDPNNTIPYQSIPVGTLKKHASGKGNCGKPEMIKAAVAKGWMAEDNTDDDEADALWILDYAINVLGAGGLVKDNKPLYIDQGISYYEDRRSGVRRMEGKCDHDTTEIFFGMPLGDGTYPSRVECVDCGYDWEQLHDKDGGLID